MTGHAQYDQAQVLYHFAWGTNLEQVALCCHVVASSTPAECLQRPLSWWGTLKAYVA